MWKLALIFCTRVLACQKLGLTPKTRELAAKFRPAKPEQPAEPAKPVTHPGLTEAERARDEMFVKSVSLLNYKHVA